MIAVETHQQTTKRWSIDPARSSVDFAVGTFWGLGTVSGRFGRIDGVYSDGPAGAKIELTVDAGTIDTGNVARDEHFRWSGPLRRRPTPVRPLHLHRGRRHRADRPLRIAGVLEAGGEAVPVEVDATVQGLGDELELEASTTVDRRGLDLGKGPFGMIRTPATVRVKARLV